MTRQANYANIVGEIFPAELGAEAKFMRFFQQFLFQVEIAECLAVLVTFRRQRVVIVGAGEFNGFQRAFRRGAANDKGDMVWRTGCGAQRAHFLNEEVFQLAWGEQRFGLLIEIRFVC